MDIDARVLPHNLEAERSVLGGIIMSNEAFPDAAEKVRPEHFFRDAHRRIYTVMCELAQKAGGIDLVTIKEVLIRKGELDEVGGPAYIAALIDGVPRSTNVAHYAQIVRERAELRALILAGGQMIASAYDTGEDASAIIEKAEQTIFALAQGQIRSGFESSATIAVATMDKVEQLYNRKVGVTGVPTGFADLDDLTRGLQPGNLILVAARPSQGKTAFAINIAQHVTMRLKRSVGVFSLEMSAEELMFRQFSSTARINSHSLQSGYMSGADLGRLATAIQDIADAPLFIDQTANIGIFEMRARARRLKAEHGLDLLIVDYLQLMTGQQDRKADNRTLELGAMTRGLKILARELNIPIVVLSQLSRAPELRADHRPVLSDLRESGSLEQDADLVLFLYRDEYYHPDRDDNRGVAEVIVGKQRNGPLGTVRLVFMKEFTRFENMARHDTYEDQRLPMGDR